MVCWSDLLDWKNILDLLGVKVSEEDKSRAIYELEEEKGHDTLKKMPKEERERLLAEKLKEMKGLGKKKKKKKKEEEEEEEQYTEMYT